MLLFVKDISHFQLRIKMKITISEMIQSDTVKKLIMDNLIGIFNSFRN